ncbi:MAG: hypothetical protein ACLRMJ_10060 [Alistipes finegoldii]
MARRRGRPRRGLHHGTEAGKPHFYARIQSSVLRSELFYQREALKEELNRRSGVRIVNAVIIR